jgi:hypothetical protein
MIVHFVLSSWCGTTAVTVLTAAYGGAVVTLRFEALPSAGGTCILSTRVRRANMSIDTDPQQQEAASRLMLCAGQLQR